MNFTEHHHAGRQGNARAALADGAIPGVLVTHPPNVRYLCGFTGSAGVFALTRDASAFFTDGRYREQARQEVKADLIEVKPSPLAAAAAWLIKSVAVIGVDHAHLSVMQFEGLRKASRKARFKDVSGMLETLRMTKDEREIEVIRDAVRVGSAVFERAVRRIRAGTPETAIAADIEYQARIHGAEGMSFQTIVASGERSALPHGRASRQLLPARGFVVLDFGVILSGYCSDMTRTVHVGKASGDDRRLYSAVRSAQEAAIAAVKPGKSAHQIDAAARKVLQEAGFGRFFTHSTGHGVGLEIHEQPRIARGCRERLKPGMVITIEPGAYIPGKGGVRIEDMVVVTETGCEVLTPTTKELIVV